MLEASVVAWLGTFDYLSQSGIILRYCENNFMICSVSQQNVLVLRAVVVKLGTL